MPEIEIGKVSHYFARPMVAGLSLDAPLSVGDTVHIAGATSDVTLTVESMQIEGQQIEAASPGDNVGLKVPDRVRVGDAVYRVTD